MANGNCSSLRTDRIPGRRSNAQDRRMHQPAPPAPPVRTTDPVRSALGNRRICKQAKAGRPGTCHPRQQASRFGTERLQDRRDRRAERYRRSLEVIPQAGQALSECGSIGPGRGKTCRPRETPAPLCENCPCRKREPRIDKAKPECRQGRSAAKHLADAARPGRQRLKAGWNIRA